MSDLAVPTEHERVDVTTFRTEDAPTGFLDRLRPMLERVFTARFDEHDWEHALGGWHAVVSGPDGDIRAHAAVVPRTLHCNGLVLRTGYGEAVAADATFRGAGYGAAVAQAITDITRREFDFGALGTGVHDFYARFGWERWTGPTYARRDGEDLRTAHYDESVMVLRFGQSADVDTSAALVCDWRPGAEW